MSLTNSVELSIIIVNYNGAKYLHDCLASVHKQCQGITYEIIIVDNQSTDKSLEIIDNNYPESILIRNTKNLGFAKANNIGVSKSNGKFILLLNNDTILEDNLNEIITFFKGNISGLAGAMSIKMLGKNREYRKSVGYFPSSIRLLKLSSLYRNLGGFSNGDFDPEIKIYDVDWIEGSFLLTTKEIWNLLNGLSESYFMYCEDIDFCKRIKQNGYKVLYAPFYSYVHYGGYNSGRQELLLESFNIYINRHKKGINRMLALYALKINKIIKYVKASI
jgi:GT2 family glycosyltransferase